MAEKKKKRKMTEAGDLCEGCKSWERTPERLEAFPNKTYKGREVVGCSFCDGPALEQAKKTEARKSP